MLIEWKKNAKCLDNIKYQQSVAGSVCVARLPQYEPDQKLWMWVSYIFIALELNK